MEHSDNVASERMNPNFYGLITKERAEKFDLLGQLILNQREVVILCGAEGSGKTNLLNTFKKQRETVWPICLLEGLEALSFEQIQIQLVSTIQQYNPELVNHDLQSALSFCEQQQQKAVLMIDDAANLTAGSITALTEYALHNPTLRIVLAFTREQLYSKNATDRVLDDCYFMELPVLTKLQLPLFLQDSSLFPGVESEDREINDKLICTLYQRTAGIPGKVIAEFPLLSKAKQKKTFSPSLKILLAGSVILMTVGSLFLIYKASYESDLPSSQPRVSSSLLKPAKLAVKQNAPLIVMLHNKVIKSDNVKPPTVLGKITESQVNKQVIQQDADEQWILQQAAGKYTLQLMALSSRQALLNIAKRHQSLQAELKILQTKSKNQSRYVLLYGSFADTKTAYAIAKTLPVEFRRAWPRQIKSLQHEVKNRTALLLKPNQ